MPFGVPDRDALGVLDSLHFTPLGVLFLGVRRPTVVRRAPDFGVSVEVRDFGVWFLPGPEDCELEFAVSVVKEVDNGGNRGLDFRVDFLRFLGESIGLNSSADFGVGVRGYRGRRILVVDTV